MILYDDTGLAAWSPYGGRIEMPVMQKLADNGVMYSQWHTTALCSPTRSCFPDRPQSPRQPVLRHHRARPASRFGCRLPAQCTPVPQVLQDNGYSTFWIGKNHNVPEEDVSSGGSKSEWPLQMGFDRFYGFLGGGDQPGGSPTWSRTTAFIEQPYGPDEGYHLSKDLADNAIRMLRDQQSSNPSKPWFMWFCPGPTTLHTTRRRDYIDKYKGKVRRRLRGLPLGMGASAHGRQGVLPEGTKLTPINPLPEDVAVANDAVRPWNTLNAEEKELFSKMAEVYARFSSTPTPRSAGSSTTWSRPGSWRTPSSSTAPTTAPPGGLAERVGEREQVLQTATPTS